MGALDNLLSQTKKSTSSATPSSKGRLDTLLATTSARPTVQPVKPVVKAPQPQKILKITPTQKNIFETVQQEAQKLIKIGTGTVLSFTQPKIKSPLQKRDNISPSIKAQTPQQVVSPIPQKDIVKPKPLIIQPNQKKLTNEQMQQLRPDFGQPKQSPSAMVTNTKQQRQQQEKILAQAKIPKQVVKKASETLKKASLDFLDSFADSNPSNPFVTFTDTGAGTPVRKSEWKKMDTEQKIGAIANLGLNAFSLPAGEAIKLTKGFSKLGAAIGVGTNTIIKYLNDPEHSIKDAIVNPENVIFGLIGGKLGAGKPKIEEVLPAKDYTPQEVIGTVIKNGLDKTPEGKTLVKTAVEAQQKGQNVTVKHTSPDVQSLEKNVQDYRSFGGYTAGKSTENAALRDIAKIADKPEVKAHTQEQITKAIENGEMKINDDGTITLYRGGKPSSKNSLMSATYDKTVAQRFADNAGGVLTEIKVKPEDIQTFIGKAEKEVLLKNEQPKPNVAQQSISDVGKEKLPSVEELDKKMSEIKSLKEQDIVYKNFRKDLSNWAENNIPKNIPTDQRQLAKEALIYRYGVGGEKFGLQRFLDDHVKPVREFKQVRSIKGGQLDTIGAFNPTKREISIKKGIGTKSIKEVLGHEIRHSIGSKFEDWLSNLPQSKYKKLAREADKLPETPGSSYSSEEFLKNESELAQELISQYTYENKNLKNVMPDVHKELSRYFELRKVGKNVGDLTEFYNKVIGQAKQTTESISDVKPNVETPKVESKTNLKVSKIAKEIEAKSKITRTSTIGTPKLAQGVRQKAIKNKIIYGFDKTFRDLPDYDKVNVKEQGTKATEFLYNQPDDAFEIAMGRKQPPNGILPESIFTAVENYAIETKNVDVLRELATRSQLTSEATGMGQRIRMLAERNPNSPAAIMRDIADSRKKAIEKKYNSTVKEKATKVVKEIKEKVKKVDKYDWGNFISSLEC